jgi:transposase
MSALGLASWQRQRLRRQLGQTLDARVFRRTLAVLEYDAGRPAAQLARMLCVSRQSIYNWVDAYTAAYDPAALEDADGRGRRPLLDEDEQHLLAALLAGSPQDLGYPHANWTVPLLQEVLASATGRRVSDDTVRRVLHRPEYVCKRPRHDFDPDPEGEKKTPHPPANPRLARAQRGAGRGRGRPAALPAAAGGLVEARRTRPGLVERPQRPAGDLRGHEPTHRHADLRPPRKGPQR